MEFKGNFGEATLVFLLRDEKVLFAKKTKKIGVGKWNGAGGGIKPGETHREGAVRELREELGVRAEPADLHHATVIDFENTLDDGSLFTCRVWVYLLYRWKGEPHETAKKELIEPTWYPKHHLPPARKMMVADSHWLPAVLDGRKIYGVIPYGPHQKFLNGEIKIINLPPRFQDKQAPHPPG